MRSFFVVLAAAILAFAWGCGSGDKPEFVEVPSGDPMPPAGEGEPIQDADDTGEEGCGATPPAATMPIVPLNERQLEEKDAPAGGFEWLPLEQRPEEPASEALPVAAVLLLPLGLALALRRR